jgi:hypothetical protein
MLSRLPLFSPSVIVPIHGHRLAALENNVATLKYGAILKGLCRPADAECMGLTAAGVTCLALLVIPGWL